MSRHGERFPTESAGQREFFPLLGVPNKLLKIIFLKQECYPC